METSGKLPHLEKALSGFQRVLILTHNNPDPDSISSACGLQYLLEKGLNLKARVAYGGVIGRAENKAMVRLLKLNLSPISKIRVKRFDSVVLVDTQPHTGYIPPIEGLPIVGVIDHHPLRRKTRAPFMDVRKEAGATATIVAEYLVESGIEIPVNIATALFYGISSETQALGRETTKADMEAYVTLFPKVNKRVLSKIEHPKLPREYFTTLHRALGKARFFKHAIWACLGDVETPEFVAQIADLLLMHERVSWSLCLGRYDEKIWLSLRTSKERANAGKVLRQLIGSKGVGGGHDMMAGGQIDCKGLKPGDYEEIERRTIGAFLRYLYKEERKGKPLLPSDEE